MATRPLNSALLAFSLAVTSARAAGSSWCLRIMRGEREREKAPTPPALPEPGLNTPLTAARTSDPSPSSSRTQPRDGEGVGGKGRSSLRWDGGVEFYIRDTCISPVPGFPLSIHHVSYWCHWEERKNWHSLWYHDAHTTIQFISLAAHSNL